MKVARCSLQASQLKSRVIKLAERKKLSSNEEDGTEEESDSE